MFVHLGMQLGSVTNFRICPPFEYYCFTVLCSGYTDMLLCCFCCFCSLHRGCTRLFVSFFLCYNCCRVSLRGITRFLLCAQNRIREVYAECYVNVFLWTQSWCAAHSSAEGGSVCCVMPVLWPGQACCSKWTLAWSLTFLMFITAVCSLAHISTLGPWLCICFCCSLFNSVNLFIQSGWALFSIDARLVWLPLLATWHFHYNSKYKPLFHK